MHTQEQPGFHGMVLFGERHLYLSHLAMFMSPHHYQAIFQVSLTAPGGNPMAAYLLDRQRNPPGSPGRPNANSKMYGFAPTVNEDDGDPLTDLFLLTDLVARDAHSEPVRSAFKGTIWRGHFETFHPHEKGGQPLLENVTATVTRTVLFRKLSAHANSAAEPTHFLFGEPADLYLTHLINRPPDYDQILAVEALEHPFSDEDLRRGVVLTRPGRKDSADRRLTEQEVIQLNAEKPGETARIRALTQHYFETDDLASGPEHHM